MSFLARVSYTADGTTPTFSFSFSYIAKSHVKAYVDNVEDTGITFPTDSSITLSSTPANGAVVLIQRVTPTDARLVDFQDGSVLTSADLDQSADQNFNIAQETKDEVASKLGLDASDRYDAGNKRIINVANPTDNQDAVTKYYLENTWLSTANKTALTTLQNNITAITNVNSNSSNINSVNSNESNINLVAGSIGSVNTVASNINDVIAVANDLSEAVSEVETVANDLNEATSEIEVVANNIANVNTVGNNISSVNTLAGISNLNNLADAHSNITVVGNNISNVNSFANTYKISATAPSSPIEGMLWWDSTNDIMKVYSGSSFQNAGSSVNGTSQRNTFTATANQTVFSGNDTYGVALVFDNNYLDVFLNGVKLVEGSSNDYTVSGGNQITLTAGASAGDILQTISYGTFDIASFSATAITSDTLPVARGGTGLTSSNLTGNATKALVVNSAENAFELANASSAEIYGFVISDTDSDGVNDTLQVITTNGGNDNISASTYASFDDVVYASTGFSWSLNSNGHLIATI
jgi:hypothetical protein